MHPLLSPSILIHFPMKTSLRKTVAASCVFSLLIVGTTLPSQRAEAGSAARVRGTNRDDGDKKDSTKPPFKGMTKAQALKDYGEPDSVGHRDGTELWTYVLNRGENLAKSYIPFNFKNSLRYRLLTFKDGKVIDFRWDAPEKKN